MSDILSAVGRAVEAAPADLALRLHFAQLLLAHGDVATAVQHAAIALVAEPESVDARAVMAAALGDPAAALATAPPPVGPPAGARPDVRSPDFDWQLAEAQLTEADEL